MHWIFCVLVFTVSSLHAGGILTTNDFGRKLDVQSLALFDVDASESLNAYFNYIEHYPKFLPYLGNAKKGEIEVILDPEKISEIEKKMGRKIGVVAEDNYWLWINDAVQFPNGSYGVYGRILGRQGLEGTTGVTVMPVLSNGKIALIRTFRHATRSWEYELPRGGLEKGETIEAAAIREAKEETGMITEQLQLLGHVTGDSGIVSATMPVFLARIVAEQDAKPEASEAIAGVEFFTIEELKKGFIQGYLETEVNGEICKIPVRDSFLAFALLQVELKDLLVK